MKHMGTRGNWQAEGGTLPLSLCTSNKILGPWSDQVTTLFLSATLILQCASFLADFETKQIRAQS